MRTRERERERNRGERAGACARAKESRIVCVRVFFSESVLVCEGSRGEKKK